MLKTTETEATTVVFLRRFSKLGLIYHQEVCREMPPRLRMPTNNLSEKLVGLKCGYFGLKETLSRFLISVQQYLPKASGVHPTCEKSYNIPGD